jgi:hypothetical protein
MPGFFHTINTKKHRARRIPGPDALFWEVFAWF